LIDRKQHARARGSAVAKRHQIEEQWHLYRQRVKDTWGKLTDDDLDAVDGHIEKLIDLIGTRYGTSKEEAREAVDHFCENL
jgi:uncharacterized protein YjbJ (UPF0337 family)